MECQYHYQTYCRELHDSVMLTNELCSPKLDLKNEPLDNPELILFVDGSVTRDPETGKNKLGYAVVTTHETAKDGSLPSNLKQWSFMP